jgi:predicted acyl esterase
MRRLLLLVAVLAASALLPAQALADVPEGAEYTEAYIETPGEPTLHADVLRPKGFKDTDKTPVILSIGPYFGHAEDPTAPNLAATPPSDRFDDMIDGGKVFERGYTVVYVDLRGFGGSAGCNDFGGRGEQIDTKRAVEWAASQPWSTGKVGMWGKSYDGWTQVMALDEKPKGLAAVVIQSPIIDGYRTLYQAGVHYETGWYITPGLYQAYDAMPPTTNDNADYLLGYVQGTNPACYGQNIAMQNSTVDRDDPTGFWKERDLPNARGSDVPTLWSHGFLDANTKPDNFLSVWETLTGPTRAWYGQYDHVRGNEADVVGRDGFLNEAMRWLDRYVKGDTSVDVNSDPRTEIQEGNGKWRAEEQWPPADAANRIIPIREGSYTDDDSNTAGGSASATGNGTWSFTQPATHTMHISGLPKVKVDVVNSQSPRANLIALVYDIAPDNKGTLITRGAIAVPQAAEPQTMQFELYPNDYRVEAGNRIGVLISGSDESWYTPPHTQATIEVKSGAVEIPFLKYERSKFLEGGEASAMANRPVADIEDDMGQAVVTADFPPALIPGGPPSTKGGVNAPPAGKPAAAKLRLTRKVRAGRTLDIKVKGAGTYRITVTLKKGSKTVFKKTVKPKKGVARIVFKVRKKGTYKLTAAAKGAGAPRPVKRTIKLK